MAIHLDRDATLIAWDAVSAGRVARGERFAFDGLYVRMRIFRDNLPEVVDGFDLYAGGEPFGGYLHVGAAYSSRRGTWSRLPRSCTGVACETPRDRVGERPAPRLCVARILARDATALYGL